MDTMLSPTPNKLTLDKFLLNYLNGINQQVESSESKSRYETIIQMCRRYRGMTPSDLFGFWHNGVWAESPKFANLHGTNIFQALINGAYAAYLQAELSLEITAKSDNFEARAMEKICRGIYEVLNRKWESFESDIFFGMILKLNAFCISVYDQSDPSHKIYLPIFETEAVEVPAEMVCKDCGYVFQKQESPEMEMTDIPKMNTIHPLDEEEDVAESEGNSEMMEGNSETCPECGSPNVEQALEPGLIEVQKVVGQKEIKIGSIKTIITDALDVSVDDLSGSGDLDSASWVQWRYLVSKGKLQSLFPHLKLDKFSLWSYPTRLKMAYKKGGTYGSYPSNSMERNLYEVKHNWVERYEYHDYISPTDFKVGDFEIKAGQSLAEVCPEGLVFLTVGNEIIYIGNEDKKKVIKTARWIPDANSIYGLGARAGLAIQKKINQIDNIVMEGESRSLRGSVIYAPEAIDGAFLEGANTNIPLKPDFALGGNRVSDFVFPIEVKGLNGASLAFLQSQVGTMQKIMGIPDVLLGAGDRNVDTARGQMLVADRASGLMVPPKKSEGYMKIGWLKDQLRLIQKYYTPEIIRKFSGMYDDRWLDDEIESFLKNDIDEYIDIEIVEGTEIPESRAMRQSRLRQDIAAGFVQLTPKVRYKLLRQSGLTDFDYQDYQMNIKLANKRLQVVKELSENEEAVKSYIQGEEALFDPETGERLTNEQGIPANNPVLMSILEMPLMKINEDAEDHDIMISFWSEKYRSYKASVREYPKMLLDFCEMMIGAHKAAAAQAMMKVQGVMQMQQALGMATQAAAANMQNEQAQPPQEQ